MNFKAPKSIIIFINLIGVSVLVVWITHSDQGYMFLPDSLFKITRSKHRLASYRNGSRHANASSLVYGIGLENQHLPPTIPPSAQTCHFTKVDSFDPKIMKMTKKFPTIDCTKGRPSLTYIQGEFLKVNITKVKEHPNTQNFSHCLYRSLTKNTKNDRSVIYGKWSKRFKESIRLEDQVLFVEAECYDKENRGISNTYASRVSWNDKDHIQTHLPRFINHIRKYNPKESLNVLLVGIDGLSVQNFDRSMPKTRDFVVRNLSAIALGKYNKVGLNTFPNVMPLLTGHHWQYFHTKNWTKKLPFDSLNHYFIWSEFRDAGYVTALDLEETDITSFHYLKKGFYKTPVDIYTRALTIAMDKNSKMRTNKMCRGDTPIISYHNQFLLQLATRFNNPNTPYFAYNFLTRLTHDDQNKASSGDELYLDFLQKLKRGNLLNNTALIFFSDHGERFGNIRNTYNGIIESKSPIGYIILPEWFQSKYPEEMAMLRLNADRLTSVLDLHATFRDILYFKSPSRPANLFPGPGISLFQKPISETRTCEEAGIPLEYCNCNSLTKVDLDDKTKKYLSSVVTDTINEKLGNEAKEFCHTIVPKEITSILLKEAPKDRKKDIFTSNSVLYHITLATKPGKGVFESVVELTKTDNKAKVIGSISRLDMYKGEKECIHNPNIRQFCFCK